MGYSTDFMGSLEITPPISPEHAAYINAFANTRRMKRNKLIAALLDDPIRDATGLHVGEEGQYFVGGSGFMGQEDDSSVVDHNAPPTGQPSLWCQWVIEDGKLQWDGGEKFYNYVEWLDYLIEHFFHFWGYSLTGEIKWQGEDMNDRGLISVEDNNISITELA